MNPLRYGNEPTRDQRNVACPACCRPCPGWRESGELLDLNHLVDIAPDGLLSAQDINEAGQITGRVRDAVSREVLAFVATPVEP